MEDREIVELFFARDERGIAEADAKFGKYCRAVAVNILGSAADAEECVNDTWLRAWESIPPNRPEHLGPYLCRISRNLAIDRYSYNRASRRNREFDVMLSEVEEFIPDVTADAAASAADGSGESEIARGISGFLRTQKEAVRTAFIRRYWYSEPLGELAAELGVSERSLAVTLFRTRKKLRAYLEKEGIYL